MHTVTIAYAASESDLFARLRLHLEPQCQAGSLRVLPLRQVRAETIARTCVETQLAYTDLYIPLLSPEFVA